MQYSGEVTGGVEAELKARYILARGRLCGARDNNRRHCQIMEAAVTPEIVEEALRPLVCVKGRGEKSMLMPPIDQLTTDYQRMHYIARGIKNDPNIGVHDIVGLTAKIFRVSREDLVGPSRSGPIVAARQIGMTFARLTCSHNSFPRIGGVFHRDHTTVLHGVRKYEAQVKEILDSLSVHGSIESPSRETEETSHGKAEDSVENGHCSL